MKLDEILNKPFKYKVTETDNLYSATFKAGPDREIVFNAKSIGEEGESIWELEFKEITTVKGRKVETYELSDNGKEFQVFATIKSIMLKFIKTKRPYMMQFQSVMRYGSGRSDLYAKLLKKHLPSNWKIVKSNDRDGADDFFLMSESLDKPLPFEVTSNNAAEFQAEFQAGNRMIRFSAFNEFDSDWDEETEDMDDDHEWSIEFSEVDSHHNSNHGKTGSGNEFQVFATIKAILEKFAKEQKPWFIKFEADKNDGNRARLYAKMIKRNLPDGWKVQTGDVGGMYQQFTLVPESLSEALDGALPYEVKKATKYEVIVEFEADGRKLEFHAKYMVLAVPTWEILFGEPGEPGERLQTKKTGKGDEFRIFATVKQILSDFIDDYNPQALRIDSFKGEPSRTKLYLRMLKKYLSGWNLEKDETGPTHTSMTLTKE